MVNSAGAHLEPEFQFHDLCLTTFLSPFSLSEKTKDHSFSKTPAEGEMGCWPVGPWGPAVWPVRAVEYVEPRKEGAGAWLMGGRGSWHCWSQTQVASG